MNAETNKTLKLQAGPSPCMPGRVWTPFLPQWQNLSITSEYLSCPEEEDIDRVTQHWDCVEPHDCEADVASNRCSEWEIATECHQQELDILQPHLMLMTASLC